MELNEFALDNLPLKVVAVDNGPVPLLPGSPTLLVSPNTPS